MTKEITFKLVKVPIEITMILPVIEGQTDLAKEIEDVVNNMVETCGYERWDFNGHYEVIS